VSISSSVLVGNLGQTVWLKVFGRGTFQNSPGVKEFVKQMIQRGHREFVIDLQECELMDSTFMGTLAGVALNLREVGRGGLRAVNVNARNASLFENLGLDHLFSVEAGSGANAPLVMTETEAVDAEKARETVLEAHEALIEADPHNEVKFKDVVEYLRQELAQENEADD